MKKKVFSILIMILLIAVSITAFAASSPKALFMYAKNTLRCLSSGDYDSIVDKLPVSGISPDRNEWERLALNSFSSLSGRSVQTKYAVAYRIGSYWRVAVPVSEPSDGNVEVLILDSDDGTTICGYASTTWNRVVAEYRQSGSVFWNDEYLGGSSVIEADSY